ncbi:C-type lectin domain-containing protein [Caenorhabditis elegans]|uniref:C-type lectin domain-containing protein n=1 Tax=Caenorhabditis elegans TaxID=6239 RepID=A4F318_CAEEL|nr:C-type lectin domain-containing protein [Caenorhabditis elegans]CCD63962.1 C-type lectin domain-containing protein [Caenorhabditis elegans]|eukprot:NP_741312.3 C-type LECtin [Caenorhabditis elegans]
MILQLFLPLVLASFAHSACLDSRDKEIKGLCFTFVSQQLTFNDARNWCHYQNPVTSSYLAYVPDQYTSSFLASDARTAFETNSGSFWIGLSRNSSSSPFAWDNGSPVTYTNFGTQLGQNYLAQSVVNTKWNAFGENDKNLFVCSYSPVAPPTFSPPSISTTQQIPITFAPPLVSTTQKITPVISTTQRMPVTEENSCKPTENGTILFAFSNDYGAQTVKKAWDGYPFKVTPCSGYAIARFDVRVEESIVYFTDFGDAQSYVYSHLPDSKLGFRDKKAGSDALQMVEKFYNSNKIPICGSIVLILLKRYPNDWDISKTVSLVRQHHGIVHALCSADPSGGTQSKAIHSLTSKTNGLYNIGKGRDFHNLIDWFPMYSYKHPIYCANPVLSGQKIIELPPMNVPFSTYYEVYVTVQDHIPISSFVSMDLIMKNDNYSGGNFQVYSKDVSGILASHSNHFSPVTYSMQLQYEYKNWAEEDTQVRVYSDRLPPYWLPYCD